MQGGDAAEVGVIGQEAGSLTAGEADQFHVGGTFFGLRVFLDLDFGERASPEVFQAFQTAAATFAFDEIRGISEEVKFIEDEPRDDERIFEKPSLANAWEAAIDQDVGIDEQALFFDAFLPEAHVRDEQGEFLAVGAQGEGDAKESESAINSDLKNLLALSLGLDVAGLEERQFTEPDAGNEPSAEQSDQQAGCGRREHADSELIEEDVEGGNEQAGARSHDGSGPPGALKGRGERDAEQAGEEHKASAGQAECGGG